MYEGDVNNPPEHPAGESQAQDQDPDPNLNDIDDPLFCNEIFSSCAPLDDSISLNDLNGYIGYYDNLDNIHLDSLPEFTLAVSFLIHPTAL